MRYDQFAGLCEREWAAGPPFGDVTALSLTDESGAELICDRKTGENAGILIKDVPEGATGTVRNPVTCTDVIVTRGAEADTATVSYGTFAWSPEPKTVTIGAGEGAPGTAAP